MADKVYQKSVSEINACCPDQRGSEDGCFHEVCKDKNISENMKGTKQNFQQSSNIHKFIYLFIYSLNSAFVNS